MAELSAILRRNKAVIQKAYWEHEVTQEEIADAFGCSRQLVAKLADELGIAGVPTSSRMQRERNHNWRGGITVSLRDGFILRTPAGKQRLEHFGKEATI